MATREQLEAKILKGFQGVFGKGFEKGKTMDVSPVIVQKTEEKVRQSYEFLNLITTTPTEDSAGQILSLAEGKSVGQRTVTGDKNHKRNPVDVGGFTGRDFKVEELELDVIVLWNTILQWGMGSAEVFNLYREFITRSRALSRLRIGFYGQSENLAVGTDLTAHPMMEDVAKGWFQYLINNAPSQVYGITAGGVTPKGYDINPINIGVGGDFTSMADFVNYLKNEHIARVHRGNTGIRAIIGDELKNQDVSRILNAAGNTATERAASESFLAMQTLGGIQAVVPDEMPSRGLFITDPKNLEYIYQTQSVRRSLEESQDKKGLVDYSWQKVDFVIKELNAIVAVHPDAIRLKDINDAWVAASDVWAINPVV